MKYHTSLDVILDAGGNFGPIQEATVASQAGPQMLSATEVWQQVEAATTSPMEFSVTLSVFAINMLRSQAYKAGNQIEKPLVIAGQELLTKVK